MAELQADSVSSGHLVSIFPETAVIGGYRFDADRGAIYSRRRRACGGEHCLVYWQYDLVGAITRDESTV